MKKNIFVKIYPNNTIAVCTVGGNEDGSNIIEIFPSAQIRQGYTHFCICDRLDGRTVKIYLSEDIVFTGVEESLLSLNELEKPRLSPTEKVKAIYDKHAVFLANMKENRAKDADNASDSELCGWDEQINTLAAVLSDLYREILHKD